MDEFTASALPDQASGTSRLALFNPEPEAGPHAEKSESKLGRNKNSKSKANVISIADDEFPLWQRKDGRWCRKIRCRVHYFGKDKDSALAEWNRTKDDLLAGREPRPPSEEGAPTVAFVCNAFLTHKTRQRDNHEITPRTWQEYHDTCAIIVKAFGRGRIVTDILPIDFAGLREQLAKRHGPVRLGNIIQRIRTTFKFAFDDGLIDSPIRYGASFKKPSANVLRLERAKKGRLDFTAEQIRVLLKMATPTMKCMILLGMCAGLGNRDCGMLTTDHLDLEAGWLNFPRPKTGIMRRAKLWPEVVKAIRNVLKSRIPSADPANSKLVFITCRGASWVKLAPGNNPVRLMFGRMLADAGFARPGMGFYSLRRTFETVAGGCLDQPSVDAVMGHVPAANNMAAIYRQGIGDDRLARVSDHVRAWLFPARRRAK